jgi:F-type H+-transporting ATPase subunit gamma
MKMVSAAKLRRARASVEASRPYAEKLSTLLARLAAAAGENAHPFLREYEQGKSHVVILTSDRGLCGGYNTNLIRKAGDFLNSQEGSDTDITVCGRRGYDHFSKQDLEIAVSHINRSGGLDLDLAREVAADVSRRFETSQASAVYLVYSRFHSAISQTPVVERILPVDASDQSTPDESREYLYEPDCGSILDSLLPRYVETRIFGAMLEATASEHGSRMTAMDSASRNARDMIDRLTLEMNRARQAAITKELMEIISGAEALNG